MPLKKSPAVGSKTCAQFMEYMNAASTLTGQEIPETPHGLAVITSFPIILSGNRNKRPMFLTFQNLGPAPEAGQHVQGKNLPKSWLISESASCMEISGGHRAFTAAQLHRFDTCPSCTPAIRPMLQAHLGTAALGMLIFSGRDQHNADPGRGSFESTL